MEIELNKVPVTIATCSGEIWQKRVIAVQKMLSNLGFTTVEKSIGKVTKPYIFGTNENAIDILSKNTVPFLYMEDDATLIKENYKLHLNVPSECDVLFLGGSTHANAHFVTQDETIIKNKAFGAGGTQVSYKKIDEDFIRIYNMFCCHAVLFLTEKGRTTFLTSIERYRHQPLDVVWAFEMPNLNVYIVKEPYFYQNDGHNDIYSKQIIFEKDSKPINLRLQSLKSLQHSLEGIKRIGVDRHDPVIIRSGIFGA